MILSHNPDQKPHIFFHTMTCFSCGSACHSSYLNDIEIILFSLAVSIEKPIYILPADWMG